MCGGEWVWMGGWGVCCAQKDSDERREEGGSLLASTFDNIFHKQQIRAELLKGAGSLIQHPISIQQAARLAKYRDLLCATDSRDLCGVSL